MNYEYLVFNKESFLDNAKSLIDKNLPLVSNLANLSRLIYDSFSHTSWAGFYLFNENDNCLYLGPFQGEIACTIIPLGKGVCGKSIELKKTQLVPNVHEYEGHIACSSLTNSELVVPILKENKILGVIDLDSHKFNNYDHNDVEILEKLADLLKYLF